MKPSFIRTHYGKSRVKPVFTVSLQLVYTQGLSRSKEMAIRKINGASVLVLAIVVVVVVLNCLRIAHANPVESLKNE